MSVNDTLRVIRIEEAVSALLQRVSALERAVEQLQTADQLARATPQDRRAPGWRDRAVNPPDAPSRQ
jgi:hypothetical protein